MNRNKLQQLWVTILLWGITLTGFGQPVAEFTANRTIGCEGAPLVVNFQDLSTGNPTSRTWQFGDQAGSSSNLQNPTFIYSQAGCYEVTLIVSNAFGSDTMTKTCFIEIFPQPVPDFTIDETSGCVPFTVNLQDNSQANDPGGITSWTYILSDGKTSSNPSPSFVFNDEINAPDTISVALTITNANGCSSTEFFDNIIFTAKPPSINFAADTSFNCVPPLLVNFENQTVENGIANPTYTWEFTGGVTAAGVSTFVGADPPAVSFNNTGQFDVSLIVQGDNACADTLVISDMIRIGGVDADFSVSATTVCVGEPITFDDLSTGGVSTTSWNFGEQPGVDATGSQVIHTYDDAGIYTITLEAQNAECGDTLVRTNLIEVFNRPVAAFTKDRELDCQPGNPFFFTNTSSAGATSFLWDFGDGTTSTQNSPSHSYTQFGTFPVCLIAFNQEGCTDTLCDTVRIAPPDVDFRVLDREGCIPHEILINDSSESPVDPIISWEWDFGDGSPTSNDQRPAHTYTAPGRYDVTLIVTTGAGCTDTLTQRRVVEVGTEPVSTFSADKTTVCVGESLTFAADSSNSTWRYYWDFAYNPPGSFTIIADSVPFTYPDTGTYSVALIANNIGCRDTTIINNYIFVSPPVANFGIDPGVVCGVPTTITISDSSVGPSDQYDWFLDGNLYASFDSAQDPPPLTISTPGVYVLTQAILNSATGCTDTFSLPIAAGDPQAGFTPSTTAGCVPLRVDFTNTSQNASSYLWEISIGNRIIRQIPRENLVFNFTETGVYGVRLIVTDAFGCTQVIDRPNLITVYGPSPNFSAARNPACIGEAISFLDSSTSFGTTIISWDWDFGGGGAGTSNLQNPTASYTATGLFDVSMTLTDDSGCVANLTIPDFIEITNPALDFTISDTSTCAGNLLSFENQSTGFGVTYLWKFGDGDTSTIQTGDHAFFPTDSTTGTFFDVTLIGTDVNGCVDSLVRSNYIFIEPFDARFFAVDTVGVCPPFPVQVVDTSIGNGIRYYWDFGDGFTQIVDTDSAGNVYRAPDFYDVQLTVEHEDGCFDTLLKEDYIFVAGPNGTFRFVPNQVCLGDTICLNLNAVAATKGLIDWKDGSVDSLSFSGISDSIELCHLYPIARNYVPDILLEDDQGCIFKLPNLDSVVIFRNPIAQILPLDTSGCSPFVVPFVDGTLVGDAPLMDWTWVLGNGDTSFVQNPRVVYFGDSLYRVNLLVMDTNGCTSSDQTEVVSFEGAIPDFNATDTTGCAPINISFSDLSTNRPRVDWTWIFGDGDTVSGVADPTHTYTENGLYTVTLIVNDDVGCADTLVREGYIDLFGPNAILTPDQTLACNPVELNFFADSTISRRPIIRYDWCLVTVGPNDTSCQTTLEPLDSLAINFDNAGEFLMILTVTDSLNCTDETPPQPITIVERRVPNPIEVRNVSVVDQNSVEISWSAYPDVDFANYVIYRLDGNNPIEVGRVLDQNTTQFVDSDPSLNTEENVYCYKVTVINFCEEESILDDTREHCTVELQVGPLTNALLLSWTPYVGYTVGQYEIYRATSYDLNTLTQIGSVPGDILNFTDTATFCSDSVFYRVRAVGLAGSDQRSYSDLAGNAPINEKPTEFVDVITATVVDDQYTRLEWTPYTGYLPDSYVIQRSLDGLTYTDLITLPITELSYEDLETSVDDQSYHYRVFALDQCGDTSQVGLKGRTILLNTSLNPSGRPLLSWNPYENWNGGVLSYTVEVFNDATGQFEPVGGVLSGDQRTFVDEFSNFPQPEYCYRIVAEEAGGFNAQSVSNVQCIVFGPQVFIPNAFTPNNDGRNDQFRIALPNVEQVEVSIYNRWGQLIFRTRNLDEFWDGTYKGRLVQEGVYVYTVTGAGFNGEPFTRTGTVTVYF